MDIHFMMNVSPIFILYTLNIYSSVCQLDLNKAGRGKKKCPHKVNHRNFIREKTGRESDQT